MSMLGASPDLTPLRNTIFQKTAQGQAEVERRASRDLGPRARALLVMVDGRTRSDALLSRLGNLGIKEDAFEALLSRRLIEPADMVLPGVASSEPASAEPASSDAVSPVQAFSIAPLDLTGPSRGDDKRALDPMARKRELRAFLTQSIRELLGVRGCFLQLAVAKAEALDDFRALRDRYLTAVKDVKGKAVARAMRDRIDELLLLG